MLAQLVDIVYLNDQPLGMGIRENTRNYED